MANENNTNGRYQLYELIDMNRGGIYHDFTHGIENRRGFWGFQPYYPPNGEPGFVNEQFVRFVESRNDYLIRKPIFNITTLAEEFKNAVTNLSEYVEKSSDKLKFYKNLRKLQEYLLECGYYDKKDVLEEQEIDHKTVTLYQDGATEIAKEVADKLQLGTPKFLGSGHNGFAYDVGGDIILKVTSEKSEAIESMKARGKNLNHIADIYNVFTIKSDKYDTTEGIYVIIQEKIETNPTLREEIKRKIERLEYVFENILGLKLDYVLDHLDKDDSYEMHKDKIDAYMKKNSQDAEFFYDLLEISNELKQIGSASVEFLNPTNLGYKNGELAFFDMGFGDTLNFSKEPEKIQVDEFGGGANKFSSDNNVGGEIYSTYNQKSTEPSISNNLDANSSMYHDDTFMRYENYEKKCNKDDDNYVYNDEKNVNEEFLGDYYLRKTDSNYEVFRNPKSIKRLKSSVRGLVTENGDLYIIDDNLNIIHHDLAIWLNSHGYPVPTNINNNISNVVSVRRYNDTNKFYLSESMSENMIFRHREDIIELLNKAKKKNPEIDFVLENIVYADPEEDEVLVEDRKKAWIPGAQAVKVKQKCRLGGLNGKSAACNQGDISNLEFSPLDEEVNLDSDFVSGWHKYNILQDGEIVGEMEVSNRDKYMILNRIYIDPDYRGMGYANEAMELLMDYADQNNKIIALTPENLWGASKEKLKRWYSSLGFKMNKGRNADYKVSEMMIRRPNNDENNNINEEVIPYNEDDVDFEYDSELIYQQAYDLAKRNGISILSGKDLSGFVIDKNNVIGAIFTELDVNNNEFSFDVAVDDKYKGSGIGKQLTQFGINMFEEYRDDLDNLELKLDVVNPHMRSLLKKHFNFKDNQKIANDRYLMSKSDT